MTTPFSIDTPKFRELLLNVRRNYGPDDQDELIANINAKIAEAVKAERDEWIAQLKLLEKKS